MPFRFICSYCKALLLEAGDEILRYQTPRNAKRRDAILSPIEAFITHKIGDTCPKCGHKLSRLPVGVEVKAYGKG